MTSVEESIIGSPQPDLLAVGGDIHGTLFDDVR